MPTAQADAKVSALTGKAYAERNGTSVPLTQGADVYATDTITTDNSSGVELLFRDKAIIKLGPDSSVVIQDFVYDGQSNPSFAVKLATGIMSSISGEVVKQNPAAFKISTPGATIGIRGTETYHTVNGDTETHAVVHISDGHIVLLTSRSGQAITLESAMQAVTLQAGNTEALTMRTFQPNEMDKLQDALRDLNRHEGPENQKALEGSENPQHQDAPQQTDDGAQDASTTQANPTSTVVQTEIRVLVVAEAGTESVTDAVQDALQNLQNSGILTVGESLVISSLDSTIVTDAGASSLAPITPEYVPPTPAAPENPAQPETPQPPDVPENSYTMQVLDSVLTASAGDDTITITERLDPTGDIQAGAGNDSISIQWANGGTVNGGEGNDTLVLGDAPNNIVTVSQVEHIYGGAGNDNITISSLGTSTSTNIYGGAGDDNIRISMIEKDASATLVGGAGNDTYEIGGWTGPTSPTEEPATIRIDMNNPDGSSDTLSFLGGRVTEALNGAMEDGAWQVAFTDSSGNILFIQFVGLDEAGYQALKDNNQIIGLGG